MTDYKDLYKYTKDLTLLYVEDDFNLKEVAIDIFASLFKKVIIASNGKEAFEKYITYYGEYRSYPDLVITDIYMPKMNGINLIENMTGINPDQKVIVISAYNDPTYLLELINIGIEHYLLKPLKLNDLFEVLFNTLRGLKKEVIIKDDNIIRLENNYRWNKEKGLLFKDNKLIKLTKKEYLLMDLFIKNVDSVSTYEEIFNVLWKDNDYMASMTSLKSIISRLRNKIPHQKIESISKLGYKLVF